MLGIPVRYLLKHPLAVLDLAANPLETMTVIFDACVDETQRRTSTYQYASDENWEQQLHERIGVQWPCELSSEFWSLWRTVMAELEARGIRPGPESFRHWNDGDAGLVRTIWCLIRHLKLGNIVETGVAHGVTSRFILEALATNGSGHLWSIDLPPLESTWKHQVGMAVGDRFGPRWSYIRGTSRLNLHRLLSKVGQLDLFVHDSLHSERNVRFELDQASAALRPGGALVVDDVDTNGGFRSFTRAYPGYPSLICEAEPVRPDLRRFNQKGLFGIILKQPAGLAREPIQVQAGRRGDPSVP